MSRRDDRHEEEFSVEPEEGEADAFGRSGKEKKLKEQLKTCQQEKQEYLDGWQRSKAELINKKKEFEEEKQQIIKRANKNLLEDLSGVLDSFSLAFANKESWEKVDEGWRKGVEYIYSQLMQTLKEYDLDEINPNPGEEFDPKYHESLETVPGKEEDDGKIASVIRKGYLLETIVLRPAHVRVYRQDAA